MGANFPSSVDSFRRSEWLDRMTLAGGCCTFPSSLAPEIGHRGCRVDEKHCLIGEQFAAGDGA